ncbi:MAG: hypothetical protein NEA02_02295 [Thermoanaerobaculia bacterium]|nr:hypothetical protein [Thermoanaerobaculia bacterium]
MRNLMRNLTLSAAALAALASFAPKAEAQEHGRDRAGESRGFARREPGRQEFREHGRQESREHAYRGPGRHAYAPPVRRFHASRYVSPFRVYGGSRFYSTRPGLGYLFVSGLGWVFPPFPGAVWVPAHYDLRGFFVESCWR